MNNLERWTHPETGKSTEYSKEQARLAREGLTDEIRNNLPDPSVFEGMEPYTAKKGDNLTRVLKRAFGKDGFPSEKFLSVSYGFMEEYAGLQEGDINFLGIGDVVRVENGKLYIERKEGSRFEDIDGINIYPWGEDESVVGSSKSRVGSPKSREESREESRVSSPKSREESREESRVGSPKSEEESREESRVSSPKSEEESRVSSPKSEEESREESRVGSPKSEEESREESRVSSPKSREESRVSSPKSEEESRVGSQKSREESRVSSPKSEEESREESPITDLQSPEEEEAVEEYTGNVYATYEQVENLGKGKKLMLTPSSEVEMWIMKDDEGVINVYMMKPFYKQLMRVSSINKEGFNDLNAMLDEVVADKESEEVEDDPEALLRQEAHEFLSRYKDAEWFSEATINKKKRVVELVNPGLPRNPVFDHSNFANIDEAEQVLTSVLAEMKLEQKNSDKQKAAYIGKKQAELIKRKLALKKAGAQEEAPDITSSPGEIEVDFGDTDEVGADEAAETEDDFSSKYFTKEEYEKFREGGELTTVIETGEFDVPITIDSEMNIYVGSYYIYKGRYMNVSYLDTLMGQVKDTFIKAQEVCEEYVDEDWLGDGRKEFFEKKGDVIRLINPGPRRNPKIDFSNLGILEYTMREMRKAKGHEVLEIGAEKPETTGEVVPAQPERVETVMAANEVDSDDPERLALKQKLAGWNRNHPNHQVGSMDLAVEESYGYGTIDDYLDNGTIEKILTKVVEGGGDIGSTDFVIAPSSEWSGSEDHVVIDPYVNPSRAARNIIDSLNG